MAYPLQNQSTIKLTGLSISGNCLNTEWLKHIKYDSGKPNLVACVLLSELVYVFKPIKVVSETGELVWRQKFKTSEYQLVYSQLEDKFGLSKKQLREALSTLCNLRLVTKRIENNIRLANNVILNNVVYIDLDIDKVLEISITSEKNQTENNQNQGTLGLLPRNTPLPSTEYPPSLEGNTKTKMSSKMSSNISLNKKTPNKFDADEYIKSLNLSDNLKESLLGLLEIRKIKKTATTQRAIDTILRDLDKWYEGDTSKKVECVDQSVKSGWTGVFEIKQMVNKTNTFKSNDWRDKRTKHETPDELKGY